MHRHILAAPQQFLGFNLGGLEYGLDYAAVQELKAYSALERFSSDGEIIGGVALSRGVIMPVVDLRAAFADERGAPRPGLDVIVVRVSAGVVGVVVERVTGVVRLRPEQVLPLPGAGQDADYLIGLGVMQERRMILIDIDRLMSLAPGENARVA
ncbi:chemotaxis protein CheW [Massilia sp. G4R7]|uniref:Chemotaxis protein CheW n=1 Tax=Massilia phyllostachyos TaxID=2898585 RepID=A0ABS8QA38_9BURK|nr:chemotaxis protein CheW [Massilia phyllostachyos]MCD2518621.1 chemotaxis protein CheW [Massilia phyllostachyos]